MPVQGTTDIYIYFPAIYQTTITMRRWSLWQCLACVCANRGHNEPPFIQFTPSPVGRRRCSEPGNCDANGSQHIDSKYFNYFSQVFIYGKFCKDSGFPLTP